jgi:hypothetical protein
MAQAMVETLTTALGRSVTMAALDFMAAAELEVQLAMAVPAVLAAPQIGVERAVAAQMAARMAEIQPVRAGLLAEMVRLDQVEAPAELHQAMAELAIAAAAVVVVMAAPAASTAAALAEAMVL